ncbi:MAG: class I SAM-dependent methyltransferase [Candidatus Thorarchaeota archaeon]
MANRGEKQFIRMPKFAVRLYDGMMKKKPLIQQRVEIAQELLKYINKGKLLDVGTGHGRLLLELSNMNEDIQLFGLDISEKMIELAKKNLSRFSIELKCGNITEAPYEDNFFNIVTCTGSFYLWDDPVKALNEIYRILISKGKFILFETHNEFDIKKLQSLVKQNLKDESFISRKTIPNFLYKQIRMTYEISEIENLIGNSQFRDNFTLEKITLANLPIWLKIEISKE